ncbi:arfaptin-2-like isoform X2 [Cyanistes caeruleus]|nr:arfaptin-2-like isoform X2 [Cyanistes caeruleus]
MSDGILSKAATMEIPISSNGDTSSLPEDDGLEQDLQQVMVSGPNLNETSIVSGGYGGTAEGIIPTGTIKGSGGWTGREWRSSWEEGGQLPSLPLTYDTKLCHGPAKVSSGWALFLLGSGSVQGQRVGVCSGGRR